VAPAPAHIKDRTYGDKGDHLPRKSKAPKQTLSSSTASWFEKNFLNKDILSFFQEDKEVGGVAAGLQPRPGLKSDPVDLFGRS